MEQKHTPGPWSSDSAIIRDSRGDSIIQCLAARNGSAQVNAQFIVRACNAHDDLMEFLKRLIEERDHHAEHGRYTGKHFDPNVQAYDDWAADIAETLLARIDKEPK